MARRPSKLTTEIREAIKQGFSNRDIAELLSCTTQQVASVRHRDKAKSKAKQREYKARYRAKQRDKQQAAAPHTDTITEVTDDEIDALRNVPNPTLPITMESPTKYTWLERLRIFFRGW